GDVGFDGRGNWQTLAGAKPLGSRPLASVAPPRYAIKASGRRTVAARPPWPCELACSRTGKMPAPRSMYRAILGDADGTRLAVDVETLAAHGQLRARLGDCHRAGAVLAVEDGDLVDVAVAVDRHKKASRACLILFHSYHARKGPLKRAPPEVGPDQALWR